MRTASTLALALVALLAPLAGAQDHQHDAAEGMAFVLHDGPDDGRAVVGAPTHFGFALLKDGVPQVHRNAEFRIVHNGQVLFETADTHEYDGHFSLDVVFPTPGPYEVFATSEGMMAGAFRGVAVLPVNETVAQVTATIEPTMAGARGATFTVGVVDADGAIIPHTDVILELREAASKRFVSRTHAHIHEAPIVFTQYAPAPGDYELTAVASRAFPTGRSADVAAVLGVFPFTAGPLPEGVSTPPATLVESRPMSPAGPSATADGIALHGAYDPQPLVGVGNPARLSAVVVDANGTPMPHVDFVFELRGPEGLVFLSESLHEYDGAFEFAFTPTTPGAYAAALTAKRGDATLSIDYALEVAPPVAPLDPGRHEITLDGLDGAAAGSPVNLTFAIASPAGPLKHSEVDITVYQEGEPPIYQWKMHTHASGESRVAIVFPHEGDWRVAVDPIPLMPQASLVERAVFQASILPGILPLASEVAAEDEVPTRALPAPGPVATLLLVGSAALAMARRLR